MNSSPPPHLLINSPILDAGRREPRVRDPAVRQLADGTGACGDAGGGAAGDSRGKRRCSHLPTCSHLFSRLRSARRDLRGKTLGCFCVPLQCHGYVLAMVANSESDAELLCEPVRGEG